MSDIAEPGSETRTKLLVNLGAGPKGSTWMPGMFKDWRELRVDVDPRVEPDIVAEITDLSSIETGSVDGVWASHCIEHLYLFEVRKALGEAHRILADDGFFCMIVPDLQLLAEFITKDKLHDVIYESPAGPVTAHDVLFGYGPYLQRGISSMAHKCGFTPTLLLNKLQEVPFAEIVLRRRANHELAAVACKRAATNEAEREAFLKRLEL
jgi:SAM-dependent methyltransferase